MSDAVRFSFKLSKHDLTSFHKLVHRRLTAISKANSKLLVANFLACIPLGLAMAAYAAMYRKYPDLTHDLNVVLAAVAVAAALLVVSILYKQRIYRNAVLSEAGWFLDNQTIDADIEGIAVESASCRASYKWASFIDQLEDASNFYLFTDNAQALVVPKSAIGPPDKIAQFRSWSRVGEP